MYLKGVLFVNSRFTKGVPFLLKMVSKTFNRVKGLDPGAEPRVKPRVPQVRNMTISTAA